MIEVKGLYAGYNSQSVLNDVSLNARPGTVTVIVGPNGCGKSTLLKALANIIPKSAGEIGICGESIDDLTPKQLAQKVAYLAQSRQVPDITALRMVLHGRFPYLGYPRRYREVDHEIARRAMEQMGIEELADKPMSTLSGGMRQKVYIAMALAQDTSVVLMDEPTTFLDVAHQLQMMEQAQALAGSGKTVILVLHDLSLALQTADRLVVMESGRIVQAGSPEEIYESGCLDRVFGVTVRRMETEDGWRYYYGA